MIRCDRGLMCGLPLVIAAAAAASPGPTPAPRIPFSTISVFEPVENRCEWRRIDPVAGTDERLASFDGGCKLARVSWSADGTKAVVRAPGTGASSCSGSDPTSLCDDPPSHLLLLVSLTGGTVTPVLLPTGDVREAGFDSKNALIALTIEITPASAFNDFAQMIRGRQGGSDLLIRSQRWTGTKWITTDAKPGMNFREDYYGKHQLSVMDEMGPRAGQLLEERRQGQRVLSLRTGQLTALFPGVHATNGWQELPTTEGRAYFPTGKDWRARGPLAFLSGGSMVQAEDSPAAGDTIVPEACDRYVFASARYTGAKPRLYDAAKAKRLFASDSGEGATLWPNPDCPPLQRPSGTPPVVAFEILLPTTDKEAMEHESDLRRKARDLEKSLKPAR